MHQVGVYIGSPSGGATCHIWDSNANFMSYYHFTPYAIYSHAYVTVSQGLNGNNWLMPAGLSYSVIDTFILLRLIRPIYTHMFRQLSTKPDQTVGVTGWYASNWAREVGQVGVLASSFADSLAVWQQLMQCFLGQRTVLKVLELWPSVFEACGAPTAHRHW